VDETERLTRRRFLHLSAVAAGGTMLAACGGEFADAQPRGAAQRCLPHVGEPTLAAEATGVTGAATAAPAPAAFKESPALAELVKAGKLPPIEQRLPKGTVCCGPGVLIAVGLHSRHVWRHHAARSGIAIGRPHIYIGMDEGLLWAAQRVSITRTASRATYWRVRGE
jgi:hypothetical protein